MPAPSSPDRRTPRTSLAGMLIALALLHPATGTAQSVRAPLTGTVLDSAGRPVVAARVLLAELRRSQVVDSTGRFRFTALPAGEYTLTVTRLGYAPDARRIVVPAPLPIEVRLRRTGITLAAVQVTATLGASEARRSPQPVAVLEGPELRVAQGAALGETLEQVPGLRSLSMGSGIGKPVIRGMTHYRVVTLDNGQRTETQAWGHDHSPNVETATAERVEVIKGPASVLYGSDALGGVVNVVAPAVPDALDGRAFLRARVTTSYRHHIRGGEGSLQLEGARQGLGARGSVTVRGSGDMRTPTGVLANTDNRAVALEGAVGVRGRRGAISARYAGRDEQIEIYDDPVRNPGYTGYQRIATHRGSVEAMLAVGGGQLQVQGGYEDNYRREFASATARRPDLGLLVRNWTGLVHLHHAPAGPLRGTFGISAMSSDFDNRGSQTLIPRSASRAAAAYVVEQLALGRWRIMAGARHDVRSLHVHVDSLADRARRTHGATTGSVGMLYELAASVTLVAGMARGFRAPAAPDLYADGFHEGTRAYERGDPDLAVETSLNRELGIRIAAPRLHGEVTGFVNTIDGYIYLRPFGTGGARFDSLEVVQGDARLVGAEARVQYELDAGVVLHASGDYVRGDNTTVGIPLTFIPPLRALYGVRLALPDGGRGFRSRYLSVTAETNARQHRVDPRDFGPPGYTLLSVGGGATRALRGGLLTLDLSAANLLDVRYRSFMSRYKAFADGPGRSLTMRASVGF